MLPEKPLADTAQLMRQGNERPIVGKERHTGLRHAAEYLTQNNRQGLPRRFSLPK